MFKPMTYKRLITSTLIPIRLVSEANNHDHWAKKYTRQKKQQQRVKLEWLHLRPNIKLPCEIHLIRHGPKPLDDDNMVHSCKAVRDQIADCILPGMYLGVADSHPQLIWKYSQKLSKTYGLQIDIYA
jgi:hypothetical protein